MFTILLPCKDHHVYTKLALKRIIECTKGKFELFIADDSERPIENEIGDELRRLDEMSYFYEILRPEVRRESLAQLRNEVFKLTETEILINVDNDVMVTPNWNVLLIEALNKHKEFGLVMPMCNDLYFYETNINLLEYCNRFKRLRGKSSPDFEMGGPEELWTAIEKTFDGSLDEFAESFATKRCLPDREFISFRNNWACWAISLDAAKEVGGYDENYVKCGYEDLDFAWRLNLCEYRTVVCLDVFVAHLMGTTRPFIPGAVEAETKNMHYYQKKWSIPDLDPHEGWLK